MRRALAAFLVAAFVGVLAGANTGGDGGAYRVRAIFDNASFLIPGEDVKIAGVKVGVIDHIDLAADNKAAVVLRIDDPAFRPFRADATCKVGLQSLIGEQFVQCAPTQARGPGAKPAPPLREITAGPGMGEHYLPVTQTTIPVNQDLLQNVMRLPERERLRLVINDLGAGLAGNGAELRAALHRANPALQATDRVISVLANQNQTLARLVDESDKVLGPLAKRRRELAGFIRNSGRTAEAAATQGDALEANLRRLPGFLRKLGPAADDFGALADQMAPALESLRRQSGAINSTVEGLGPTARAATPALVALGTPAATATKAIPSLAPATKSLRGLAGPLRPLSKDLGDLSSSFDSSGGIEDVMKFIYYYTAATNGEDQAGHYFRGALQVNVCSGRMSIVAPGCESNFSRTSGAKVSSAAAQEQLLNFLLGKQR